MVKFWGAKRSSRCRKWGAKPRRIPTDSQRGSAPPPPPWDRNRPCAVKWTLFIWTTHPSGALLNWSLTIWVELIVQQKFAFDVSEEPMVRYFEHGQSNPTYSIQYAKKKLVLRKKPVSSILSLTHWGRVTHICVGKLTIIGSDNGLSPGRRQAIIWTNAGILLIEPFGTNFSEIFIKIHTFSYKKMQLKTSSAKRRPFCLGLNVLIWIVTLCGDSDIMGKLGHYHDCQWHGSSLLLLPGHQQP